jgi:hypothetical protein
VQNTNGKPRNELRREDYDGEKVKTQTPSRREAFVVDTG